MLEKVKGIVAESLGVDEATITEESSFQKDLGADSLDLMDMVMALEDEYGVEIPTDDLEQLVTVGDVVKYIEKLS
jgi:acyl carrier protein